MEDLQKAFGEVFSQLAKDFKKLSSEDFNNVLNGSSKLRLSIDGAKSKTTRSRASSSVEEFNIAAISEQLTQFSEREEAITYLKKVCPKKDHLKAIAKHLEVPILSKDTIPKIQQKIAEATVGHRLRSQAIQGKIFG